MKKDIQKEKQHQKQQQAIDAILAFRKRGLTLDTDLFKKTLNDMRP